MPDPNRLAKATIFHAPPGIVDLGINTDHVATLRDACDTTYPDLVAAALLAKEADADLITPHLRKDHRHIKNTDVRALRPQLCTRVNLECAATQEMLDIVRDIGPQDVCLVPEHRQEVTTEGSLDVVGGFAKV